MPRELIEPRPGDKRYVRRSKTGQFKESDDVGRSLAADRRKKGEARCGRRERRPRGISLAQLGAVVSGSRHY